MAVSSDAVGSPPVAPDAPGMLFVLSLSPALPASAIVAAQSFPEAAALASTMELSAVADVDADTDFSVSFPCSPVASTAASAVARSSRSRTRSSYGKPDGCGASAGTSDGVASSAAALVVMFSGEGLILNTYQVILRST